LKVEQSAESESARAVGDDGVEQGRKNEAGRNAGWVDGECHYVGPCCRRILCDKTTLQNPRQDHEDSSAEEVREDVDYSPLAPCADCFVDWIYDTGLVVEIETAFKAGLDSRGGIAKTGPHVRKVRILPFRDFRPGKEFAALLLL